MGDITDFNDLNHRIESASAKFQKGLYHLFMLNKRNTNEVFETILRTYQCLFDLSATQLLLDKTFSFSDKKIPSRLKQMCKNYHRPTRDELDPASFITHAMIEKDWKGFAEGHILHNASKCTLELYKKVVEARHNLLYRPFMLNGPLWEDCTLIDLLGKTPKGKEIEQAYLSFFNAILQWCCREKERVARYFIRLLFMPYKDECYGRPTKTLLITYARMLTCGNQQLLKEIRDYRNELFNVPNLLRLPNIGLLKDWKCGEL